MRTYTTMIITKTLITKHACSRVILSSTAANTTATKKTQIAPTGHTFPNLMMTPWASRLVELMGFLWSMTKANILNITQSLKNLHLEILLIWNSSLRMTFRKICYCIVITGQRMLHPSQKARPPIKRGWSNSKSWSSFKQNQEPILKLKENQNLHITNNSSVTDKIATVKRQSIWAKTWVTSYTK